MMDYAELALRRNRGWPWPEKSRGLTPMYDEDGWCDSCGMPNRAQWAARAAAERAQQCKWCLGAELAV